MDYIHRIGRTGRAGKKGMATTFLTSSDDGLFFDLKKFLQDNGQIVPNELANHPATRAKGTVGEGKVVPTSTQIGRN